MTPTAPNEDSPQEPVGDGPPEYLQYVIACPSGPNLKGHKTSDLPSFELRYAQVIRRAAVDASKANQIPQDDPTVGLKLGGEAQVAEAAEMARNDKRTGKNFVKLVQSDVIEPLDGDEDIPGWRVEFQDFGRSDFRIDAWELGLVVYSPADSPTYDS